MEEKHGVRHSLPAVAGRVRPLETGEWGRLAEEGARSYSLRVTLKVLIHTADEGGFWAELSALLGCVSQGETVDEVRANVRKAIEGWLRAED